MKSTQIRIVVVVAAVLSVGFSGCGNKFFDPTQVGRFRPVPAVNVILDSLGVAEETPVAWESAEEPRPSDVVAMDRDYVFRGGDVVRVSIYELYTPGVAMVNDYVVTETGRLSIPDVGVVQAAGLTETQLEEEIRQILSPSILKDPSVVATLMQSQQRTFSVLGDGVPAPGRYMIPRYDFRLADALATAGGPAQFNVSYIYVARKKQSEYRGPKASVETATPGMRMAEPGGVKIEVTEPNTEPWTLPGPGGEPEIVQPTLPALPAPPANDRDIELPEITVPLETEPALPQMDRIDRRLESEREMLDLLTPRAQGRWPASGVVLATAEMIGEDELGGLFVPEALQDAPAPGKGQENGSTDLTQRWPEVSRTVRAKRSDDAAPSDSLDERLPQIGIEDLLEPESKPTGLGDTAGQGSGPVRWVYKDGKWIPMQDTAPAAPVVAPQPTTTPAPVPQAAPAGGEIDLDALIKGLQDGAATPEPMPVVEREVGPGPVAIEPILPEVGVDETMGDTGGQIEWVFKDGKWVPVQVGAAAPKPMIRVEPRGPVSPLQDTVVLAEDEWSQAVQYRLIRIPADKLLAGDPRYNVVIQPGDSIHVPVDIIGECLVMGNVNRQGYINITGRPMTLKMAVAAAGGLGPLAWPKRCEVIRRIGEKKEEIVLVDLDKIAKGEQPDFFIKPNDLINVGTDPSSRWRFVLRNSFRATYGFGFLYDRNFADRDFGNDPLPF
ncbi:MAG TPA: hypothetical protein ENN81_04355 [Phycisphaerales bacterium]|nr:hypothetical protein [Phycisphaerales bacterium]